MGNEVSSGNVTSALKATKRSGNLLVAGWQKRKLPTQLFGVVRHTERADGVFAFWEHGRWSASEDSRRFPLDPPLSDAGHEQADILGLNIQQFAEQRGTDFHVVVCSPYARCVQTAVKICNSLGPRVKMLIDQSLGEIFGPAVMGEVQPHAHLRSFTVAVDYCRAHGVKVVNRIIGQPPVWPESLQDARRRYALRFLQYLQRGSVAKRNFLIVTHGDCIGSVMGIMPEQQDYLVQKVEYGATILGARNAVQRQAAPAPGKGLAAVVPFTAEDEAMVEGRNGFPSLEERLDHIAEGFEDTEGSGQHRESADKWAMPLEPSGKSEPELNKLTGKAMTGWNCQTMNISVQKKKSKASKLAKRLTSLVESGPFSMQKVEKLLGAIPQTPLGDSTPLPLTPANHSTTLSVQSGLSASTYLFGGSQVDSEDFAAFPPPSPGTPQNQRVLSSQLDLQKRKMELIQSTQIRSASAIDKLSLKNFLTPLEGVKESDVERSPSKGAGEKSPERKASVQDDREEEVVSKESSVLVLDGKHCSLDDHPASSGSLVSQVEAFPEKPLAEASQPPQASNDTTSTATSAGASPSTAADEPKAFSAPGKSSLLARRRASLGIKPLGQ
mmetsp:Transcript_70602/g.165559  ORF Transcript_70602/g.165559 Transcript_70602/m.165559 type:complete len:611 (+) Transcript_70602:40-1872(+)